ncbi:MAG: hypothetical protein JWM19_6575, partial [Actinomycetia bacterium]|nr:hypothetical protein [Actinomycetes bacterium]
MPLFTLPFSTRIRPPTPRRPARLALAAAAVAASVTLAGFAPAALAGASVPSGGSALAAATVAGREHPRPATRGVSARGADAFAEEAADAVRSARKPMSPVTSSGGASVFGAAAPDVVSAGHHFYIGSISLNDGVVLRQLAAGVAPGRLGLKQASRATITAPAPTATRPGTTVQTEPTVQTGTTVHTDAVVHPDAAGPTTMYPPTYVDPSSPRYTVSSDAFPNNGEWTAIPAPMTKADCLRNIGGPTGTWVEDRFRSCAAYTGYSWVDPDPYDPAAIAGFSFDMVVTAYGSSTARNMQFSYYASNFQFENTGYLNDLSISMSCTPGNTVGDCHFDRGTFNETAGDWAAAPAGTAQVTFNASSDDDPAHVYASDPDKLTPAQASTTYGFEAGDPIVEQYPQP